jgi:hypothetical protein
MARMMRAILLASAMAASFFGLRASNYISHGESLRLVFLALRVPLDLLNANSITASRQV